MARRDLHPLDCGLVGRYTHPILRIHDRRRPHSQDDILVHFHGPDNDLEVTSHGLGDKQAQDTLAELIHQFLRDKKQALEDNQLEAFYQQLELPSPNTPKPEQHHSELQTIHIPHDRDRSPTPRETLHVLLTAAQTHPDYTCKVEGITCTDNGYPELQIALRIRNKEYGNAHHHPKDVLLTTDDETNELLYQSQHSTPQDVEQTFHNLLQHLDNQHPTN